MIDLALSVLCSSLIFVIFKLFSVYKVETFYAITTNYFVACAVGLCFYGNEIRVVSILKKPWFFGTFALGFLFIIVFNLMAATSQRLGISVASVATKMSLVLPVLFGVFYYQEILGRYQIIGIMLALTAVYFASIKETTTKFTPVSLLLPFFVFLGSGAIDISLAFLQGEFITNSELPLFSATIFASAATIGFAYLSLNSFRKGIKVNIKNVLAGFALGIPNYFSIYFLLRALQNDTLNSASVFTVNNVAIVMLTTLLGIMLFKEELSITNWGGIFLAVISILLVTR